MCRSVLAAVLVLAAFVSAQEQPFVPGQARAFSRPNDRLDRTPMQARSSTGPVWTELARMSPAERANARINIVLAPDASPEALALARTIEANWNGGRYDDALSGFKSLARLTDPAEIAFGCSWRTPVPTLQTALWGDDVQVGSRDSIARVALDIHRATGHLFTVVHFASGAGYQWAVNFSTDGGQTWSETFTWNASYHMKSLSASVLANHCYIAFGRGPAQDQAFLYRCKASDGAQEDFNNGSAYITVFTVTSDSIKEVALTSNQDSLNNRLYYTAITTDGNLRFFWDDTGATSWSEITTGVTNADRGLSAATNQGFDSLYAWAAYYSKTDDLRIDAATIADQWKNVTSNAAGTSGSYDVTSIGAYKDTITCAYAYDGAAAGWCKTLTSWDEGKTWYWLFLDPDTLTVSEAPSVALRGGGGAGAIYRYYTPTRELRYTWRHYAGAWSTPVSIADYEPYFNRPAIEYLGGGVYGVVYVRWSNFTAYFDRTDWTGVAEQRRLVVEENILSVTPNPLSGHGRLNYTLKRASDLRVQVYDRTGRAVRTLFAGYSAAGAQSIGFDATGLTPGVYFVRADADGMTLTVPITVVK